MWDLSEYLGDDVQAMMTDFEQDFALPDFVVEGEAFHKGQRQVLSEMGIDPDSVVNIRQVHGGVVLNLSKGPFKKPRVVPEADGVVSNLTDVTLAVRTADCIPVFLYDPVGRCIGMVHAGWKSTQQGIVGNALQLMFKTFKTEPADVKVVLGPSIHDCCYQVDQEFCEWFPEQMIPRFGDWFLDLQGVNIQQMLNFGILKENIYDSGMCTCCNDRFFSFRRDKGRAGRHLSLIRIKT